MPKKQFWYLDSDDITVTSDAATNDGIKQRGLLSHGGATVKTLIPLNRYSFFEQLWDKLLPQLQLDFEIELQGDNEMIFQNDATGRRIVVRRFELWVPHLRLPSEGQKFVNENFLKPTHWRYLQETLNSSTRVRDASGSWEITAAVKNPNMSFCSFNKHENKT